MGCKSVRGFIYSCVCFNKKYNAEKCVTKLILRATT